MKVVELLNVERDGWNEERIRELFLPFGHERILSIRISDSSPGDYWCWDAERDGIYTVRSAYKLLTKDGVDLAGQYDEAYKLLTKDGVGTHKSSLELSVCPRCQACAESCLHVIWGCGWAAGIWEELGMDVSDVWGLEDVREWVEVAVKEMDARDRGEFMTICWAIWERRNKALFDDGDWRVESVVTRVREVLWEMRELMV
ncbi:uncharacterized protein LOC141595562 [Silene latifolia]|uniref:uncharacterized protein LOC141595562 n=1 Tax=Silene latifolia TaxID=37657 RepID=UPI003D778F00